MPHELLEKKKKKRPFLVGLWCATKSGFYITTSDDQLSCWTKMNFQSAPKAKHAPEKDHSHCSVVCSLADSIQLSESQWNHYIWEVCSASQWDAPQTAKPAAGTGQQEGPSSSPWPCPTSLHTTNATKVEQTGLQNFASSTMFTWPLANQRALLQATQQLFFFFFCRENASITNRRQTTLSKSSLNPEAWIFNLQE